MAVGGRCGYVIAVVDGALVVVVVQHVRAQRGVRRR